MEGKNKGVWSEALREFETRLGNVKILKKVRKAGAVGGAGEAAAQNLITTLTEKRKK